MEQGTLPLEGKNPLLWAIQYLVENVWRIERKYLTGSISAPPLTSGQYLPQALLLRQFVLLALDTAFKWEEIKQNFLLALSEKLRDVAEEISQQGKDVELTFNTAQAKAGLFSTDRVWKKPYTEESKQFTGYGSIFVDLQPYLNTGGSDWLLSVASAIHNFATEGRNIGALRKVPPPPAQVSVTVHAGQFHATFFFQLNITQNTTKEMIALAKHIALLLVDTIPHNYDTLVGENTNKLYTHLENALREKLQALGVFPWLMPKEDIFLYAKAGEERERKAVEGAIGRFPHACYSVHCFIQYTPNLPSTLVFSRQNLEEKAIVGVFLDTQEIALVKEGSIEKFPIESVVGGKALAQIVAEAITPFLDEALPKLVNEYKEIVCKHHRDAFEQLLQDIRDTAKRIVERSIAAWGLRIGEVSVEPLAVDYFSNAVKFRIVWEDKVEEIRLEADCSVTFREAHIEKETLAIDAEITVFPQIRYKNRMKVTQSQITKTAILRYYKNQWQYESITNVLQQMWEWAAKKLLILPVLDFIIRTEKGEEEVSNLPNFYRRLRS